jgi:lipopolysaccharide/colanic/teichoic acid biosynthesis glycosyltransferase/UDP-N-acetylglucosamine:LPS N-acetylglucosamine transferase
MTEKKVKICHVAAVDITVKFLLQEQLKFLVKEGYDVSVIYSEGRWKKEMEAYGIKVKNIKITRKITPISDLISLIKLFLYFKKEKFDIVHTHTPKPALLGQMAAKFAGVPVIVNTVHGLYFQKNSSFLKRKFYILTEKIGARFSTLIFSQNKEDIQTMVEEKIANPQKIKYLGNGVDIERFNPLKFSEDFVSSKKRELGIEEGLKVIGTVGRLVKEKGYFELFLAFKKVLEKFPRTLLLVIGPKDFEKNDAFLPEDLIKECGVENNVLFLGERLDVEELYPLMDIFVLASYREGFPRTIIEAMASGKPVVATDIRGCRDAVENKYTGILVPVKNRDKLAEAIINLLSRPAEAKKMGENSRKKTEKEFDERLIFDRIKEGYKSIICHRKIKSRLFQIVLKRVFDIVVSLIGLVLLSPLFLLVAVLIKLDSSGPVFFLQERIGKNKKSFFPYKFRTMVQGAADKGLGFTVAKDDERITKTGKFLRKYGIDEFPQLINVLKGEMSLVGPRPTLRYQVEKYNEFEKRRLLAKPGLAGWAMVHGRNSLTWPERIKYDVWYVDNWSFWLDIKIIFKTFYLIFIRQEGVYGKDGINDPFDR